MRRVDPQGPDPPFNIYSQGGERRSLGPLFSQRTRKEGRHAGYTPPYHTRVGGHAGYTPPYLPGYIHPGIPTFPPYHPGYTTILPTMVSTAVHTVVYPSPREEALGSNPGIIERRGGITGINLLKVLKVLNLCAQDCSVSLGGKNGKIG